MTSADSYTGSSKLKGTTILQIVCSQFPLRFVHYELYYCNHPVESNHTDKNNKSDWCCGQNVLNKEAHTL